MADFLASLKLADNQLVTGGAVLALAGGALRMLQPLQRVVSLEAKRRLTVSREVTTNDKETFDIIGVRVGF